MGPTDAVVPFEDRKQTSAPLPVPEEPEPLVVEVEAHEESSAEEVELEPDPAKPILRTAHWELRAVDEHGTLFVARRLSPRRPPKA